MSQNLNLQPTHSLSCNEYFNHFYDSINPHKNIKINNHSNSPHSTTSPNQFLRNLEQINDLISPRIPSFPNSSHNAILDINAQSPTKSPSKYSIAMRNNTTTPTNKFSSPFSLEPSSPSTNLQTVPLQTTYSLETFSSFLLRLGASYHPECERLKKLGGFYDFARVLPEKEETIFNAISCCIFEKLVNMDSQALIGSQIRALFGTEEWVRSQLFLFTTLLKGLGQELNSSRKITKLYEAIVRDTNLFQKGIAATKEIIEKILKQVEFSGEKFKLLIFFKWMNEFDNLTNEFFKKLAHTLQVNLKFIVMTATTLKEENYTCSQSPSSFSSLTQENNELVIFYHKSRDQAFLLSPNSEVRRVSLENGSLSLSPSHTKPSSFAVSLDILNETPKNEPKMTPHSYNFKVLPVIKEDEVEMRYGTLQNPKPKINNENLLLEKPVRYSTPMNTENHTRSLMRNPSIHLKIETDNRIDNLQLNSPLGSDWLSKDSFSDLPSQPDGLDNSFLSKHLLSAEKLDRAKRQIYSPMHSINLVRSISEPQNKSFTSFTPKPIKGGGLYNGNFLDELYDKTPKALQVQTPNRIIHKRGDFQFYQENSKLPLYKDNAFIKKESVKEEAPTKLPESFNSKLFRLNQSLNSHNPEFENVTASRFRSIHRKEQSSMKIWNLDPLLDKYHEILNRGKKESSPMFQPLAAMRMDE